MNEFVKGQRWISTAEPELGLGTVTEVQHRRTSVSFFGSHAKRQYANAAAPLKRVRFRPGDDIMSRDEVRLHIDSVKEIGGLLVYCGSGKEIFEYDVCDTLSFSTPRQRLVNGLADSVEMFNLRYATLNFMARIKKSAVRGFVGGRVNLIAHQFYIAQQVAMRVAPRVLLSDEVGLGKTIEAGLIIHRLLACERIRRVLIIVPESLVHQWFVELWRRFNLLFSIVDESGCRLLEKQNFRANPFFDFQLGICSIGFFENKHRKQQALAAGWDMLVVDEAHHIIENSPAYRFIKSLGQACTGMMLLTATPDQLGERSHFARLRLLDPERYHDYAVFTKQADNYHKIAALTDHILTGRVERIDFNEALSLTGLRDKKEIARFKSLVNGSKRDRETIAGEIVDRCGTGRVIFRNTRRTIDWLPRRLEKIYPIIATPEDIRQSDLELERELDGDEKIVSFDYRCDLRILFLVDLLKKLEKEKILVFCRTPEKAVAIEAAIKTRVNIKIASFNENMTLIQRDRNAAWFSESEGAQMMICSEIGSEGRNFQFARHMVMFDLPVNPEVLEQRLGRLDRIGQTRDIFIHIPYVKGSASEILVNWFSSGIEIFENNVSGLYLLYKKFGRHVSALITAKIKHNAIPESDVTALIHETAVFRKKLSKKLGMGRNRILELSSFHAGRAKQLTDQIAAVDKSRDLDNLMFRLFHHYGITVNEISDRTWRLNFNDLTGSEFPVPALGENKKTVTFDREKALVRGEIDFLSWDHPMVTGAMELLLGTEKGNSCVALWKDAGRQDVLLEAIFVLECIAPAGLHMDRFLPASVLRLVTDSAGKEVSDAFPLALFEKNLENGNGPSLQKRPEIIGSLLPEMITASVKTAQKSVIAAVESAVSEIESVMGDEIRRLKTLQKVNPDIRREEIESLEKEKQELCRHMRGARFRLDALRVVLLS